MQFYNTGLSALRANQVALQVVSNNIANANTPDYHRQVVRFADRRPVQLDRFLLGQGVQVADIHRARDLVTEEALTRNLSESSDIRTRLTTAQQIESLLTPGAGTLHDRLETFYSDLQQLSSNPEDDSLKSVVLEDVRTLTRELNHVSGRLLSMQRDLEADIQQVLDSIEEKAVKVTSVEPEIRRAQVRGMMPNDLLDQRDRLINEMAELVDIRGEKQVNHGSDVSYVQMDYYLGDGMVSIGPKPIQLSTAQDADGKIQVHAQGFTDPVRVRAGRLNGLLVAHNELIPDAQRRLDELAAGLMQALDGVHATGLGMDGPFTDLTGQRSVSAVDQPLRSVETTVPVQAGELYLTITDTSTNRQTLERISFDPATQSLQDVAAAISGLDHIQAVAEPDAGTLTLLAEQGYRFDFTGRPQTRPETSSITGTIQPHVEGVYRGNTNEELTMEVRGSGTVGVTADLTLEVRDSRGTLVGTHNIGLGYEPNAEIDIADGVTLRLASGTANNGDQFQATLVAQPDSTGLLTALGLNTLFAGDQASNLQVNPLLQQTPGRFASTHTASLADTSNIQAMLATRDQLVMGNGTQTLEQGLTATITRAGIEVRDLSQIGDNLDLVSQALNAERESLSGVDPNEEMMRMLQYQRAFQSAARFITTMDETLQELINIIR